jgi:phosphoadenosine phosphosulfate reductase
MQEVQIKEYCNRFRGATPREVLEFFLSEYKGQIAFATSLGLEDQVLTHMITSISPDTKIFTLDTGRLFPETYDLIDKTNSRFKIKLDIYFPDTGHVENMVKEKGINLFYESIENRKLCCEIRKIEPLHRAMKGLKMWITGLRKEQSTTRENGKLIEVDENNNGLLKLNPLINWSEKMVWDYIKEHNIPFNELHKKGFPSIGCQPCTRAVKPGEDIRSGRWWWELEGHKECGLHER